MEFRLSNPVEKLGNLIEMPPGFHMEFPRYDLFPINLSHSAIANAVWQDCKANQGLLLFKLYLSP